MLNMHQKPESEGLPASIYSSACPKEAHTALCNKKALVTKPLASGSRDVILRPGCSYSPQRNIPDLIIQALLLLPQCSLFLRVILYIKTK